MEPASAGASTADLQDFSAITDDDNDAGFHAFKDQMPYQAQLLARFTQNDYLSRITGTGIAPAQAYVLGELWLEQPLSQVELARRLVIGKATIGKTLNRLEKVGVIERRRTPSDRRVIMIHLTQAGQALRRPLSDASEAQVAMLIDRLGHEAFAQLSQMLKQTNDILRNNGLEVGS